MMMFGCLSCFNTKTAVLTLIKFGTPGLKHKILFIPNFSSDSERCDSKVFNNFKYCFVNSQGFHFISTFHEYFLFRQKLKVFDSETDRQRCHNNRFPFGPFGYGTIKSKRIKRLFLQSDTITVQCRLLRNFVAARTVLEPT